MEIWKLPERDRHDWYTELEDSSEYSEYSESELEEIASALEYVSENRKNVFYTTDTNTVSLPATPYNAPGMTIPYWNGPVVESIVRPSAKTTESIITTTNQPIKEIPMYNVSTIDNLTSKYFSRVAGVVIDLQTGKLGIKTADGVVTLVESTCELQPIAAFSMPIPAYAIRTPMEQITEGDIILHDNMKSPVFVLMVDGERVLAITPEGMNVEFTPVRNSLFGSTGVMAVRNMFAANGGAGLNSLMPLLLMKEMGGSSLGDDKLGLFLAMQGGGLNFGGNTGDGMAGMLPLLLMGGGEMSVEKLMMMQMMQQAK